MRKINFPVSVSVSSIAALPALLLALMLLVLTGLPMACNDITPAPSGSSVADSSSSGEASASEAETGPELKLVCGRDKLMLWPADLPVAEEYAQGEAGYFYVLNEASFEWEPAVFSAEKIGNIEGKTYDSEDLVKLDVFEVTAGGWTDYYYRDEGSGEAGLTEKVLAEIFQEEAFKAMHTQDYAVIHVLDNIYVIDDNNEIRMASHRTVGGFDYDTADKTGKPDLFAWEWIWQPVCSPEDNVVIYLTSREGEFYSVWSLDLDTGEEKNTGREVTSRLNTTDGLPDNGSWILEKADGKIFFRSSPKSVSVDADEAFTVLTGEDLAFLVGGSDAGEKAPVFFVDLTDGSVKESWYYPSMKIDGWRELLERVG